MEKLIVTFRDFVKAPKLGIILNKKSFPALKKGYILRFSWRGWGTLLVCSGTLIFS
jgi:hypothetical protein